jgi:hypothetical protein
MWQLMTEADFLQAEAGCAQILLRDSANGRTRHRLPCRHVTLRNFTEKVIKNGGRNGSYWLLDAGDLEAAAGSAKICSACTSAGLGASRSPSPITRLAVNPRADEQRASTHGAVSGASLRWIGNAKSGFEAWCSRQIDLESKPPDPRGSVTELIRGGLREMRPATRSLLRATFRAASMVAQSDVENLLFTNVDATGSLFRPLVGDGLEFEFKAGDPSGASPEPGLVCCSVYDWIARSESDAAWAKTTALATWTEVPVPGLGAITRAPAIWWILRRARFVLDQSAGAPGLFGVGLRVQVPPGLPFNAAASVKPVVDAVVLCLSAENGRSSEEGIAAMARYAGAPKDDVKALLCDDSKALLGKHRLVTQHGQVSPPDHGCIRGRLVVDASADDQWRLSARFVALG